MYVYVIRRMSQMKWRWWSSPVFGHWQLAATTDLRSILGSTYGWGTILNSSTRASSAPAKYRMLHVLPSRNCKSPLPMLNRNTTKNSVLVNWDSFVIPFNRVSVMGNNFTYNSSEFGRNDVYNTIRTYLSTGKINFIYSGCVLHVFEGLESFLQPNTEDV